MESLEEFRKNPHVQIPYKSSCRIFQSLAKFQNPLKFEIQIPLQSFFHFDPAGPGCHAGPLPFPGCFLSPSAQQARVSLAPTQEYAFPSDLHLLDSSPPVSSTADVCILVVAHAPVSPSSALPRYLLCLRPSPVSFGAP
jgi:hypothetical protein